MFCVHQDFILISEGTRIAIQYVACIVCLSMVEVLTNTIRNMTWGGKQGFQTPIQDETFTVKNMGVFGNMHTERKLTYVEFFFSGHMTPRMYQNDGDSNRPVSLMLLQNSYHGPPSTQFHSCSENKTRLLRNRNSNC